MSGKTRLITTSALMMSLSVVFLYLSGVFESMQLVFVAASSLFVTAQVIENGLRGGAFVAVGSALLGALIVPDKTSVILYVLFFGYYPLVKSLAERQKSFVAQWAIKLAVMGAAMAVILYFFGELIFSVSTFKYGIWVLAALFALDFILFDIGLTQLISLYMHRIHNRK